MMNQLDPLCRHVTEKHRSKNIEKVNTLFYSLNNFNDLFFNVICIQKITKKGECMRVKSIK